MTDPDPATTSLVNEPWRFNLQSVKEHDTRRANEAARARPPRRRRTTPAPTYWKALSADTFVKAEREGKVSRAADLRHPKTLIVKARELGLPVTEYDSSLSMAIRLMEGGRDTFLRFVMLAASDGDDDALKFIHAFGELRLLEQQRVSFDLLCLTCGVSPVLLLKSVVGVAFDTGIDTANLVAAAAHPSVVARTIESAQRLDSEIGAKDRHALLAHHGFVPTPKSATINVNANANASASAAAATSADASVPKFLGAAKTAAAARESVQHQLSAPDPDAIIDVDVQRAPVYQER